MRKILIIFVFVLGSCGLYAQDQAIAHQYFNDGNFEKALVYFEKLHRKNPMNQNYIRSLVYCYQELDRLDDAENLLKEQLTKSPVSPVTYIDLGYNYGLKGNEKEEDACYDKAIASLDERPSYAYSVGHTFKNKALLDEAIRAFKKGMELDPNLNFNYDLAYIYGEKGDLENMYETYLDLIVDRSNLKENIKRNIGRFIFDDEDAESNALLRKILLKRAQTQPNILWNELLSWLFIQQKHYRSALTQEKAIYNRAEEPSLDGIIDLGMIAYDDNDMETAKSAFDFIREHTSMADTKLEAELYLLKIRILSSTPDDYAAIEKQFNALLETYGANQTTVALQLERARFSAFTLDNGAEAVKILKTMLEEPLSKYERASVKMELGDILVYMEQFNQALIYYAQVQKEMKNDVLGQTARFKVAQASFYKGDFEWAETQAKVLKSSTSQLIANDALQLKLLISDNTLGDSLQTALKIYAKADLMAYQEKDEAAIALLDSLLVNHKGEDIEDEALLKQASLFRKKGEFEMAEKNYVKIINFFADGILMDDALYELGMLYMEDMNSPEKAKPLFERLIFEHQDSVYFVEARKVYRKLRGDVLE
ncbi:tetratricopeptide repeat protein [Robertkochia solimangrovi]|uniref:tetratricopeptide repeat protein n=1 Tax=Robertkochia solimangrovi TaxID=2213046 RepID=UPI00117F871F|nr:tetratricopeptide repeat protein [Robertkochia solimangrovi]TRZ43961.1 hypothetical protein DMZ48_08360 [Robertkochia solimangrovi]